MIKITDVKEIAKGLTSSTFEIIPEKSQTSIRKPPRKSEEKRQD